MQTYPTKSGGGYFFAGLLFALVLGGRLLDASQRKTFRSGESHPPET